MGLLDTIEGMAGQGSNSNVAGGMMQALEEHPGGLGGVMAAFRSNGMAGPLQSWQTGQETTATPEQIQQGLGGTGFIENVAAKAGVSPEVAKVVMATVLPMVLAHFTNGGQTPPPQNGYSGMASEILGKIL